MSARTMATGKEDQSRLLYEASLADVVAALEAGDEAALPRAGMEAEFMPQFHTPNPDL